LCTEEQKALNMFKEAFGESLLHTNSMRHMEYDGVSAIPSIRFPRENDKYLCGLEYLADVMLLAECDAFISTITFGSVAALCINGNRYLYKQIIDLGVY